MNFDEKVDMASGFAFMLLQGAGIGIGIWFASDVGTWGWLMPLIFVGGFAAMTYTMWQRVEAIVSRVRIEEIDRHIASLDEIRRRTL